MLERNRLASKDNKMTQGIAYRAGLQYLHSLAGANGVGHQNLVRYRNKFFMWTGSCYRPATNEDIQGYVTKWLARNPAVRTARDCVSPVTSSFVRDVMLAITAEAAPGADLEPGTWIKNRPADAVGPYVSTAGGILDLGRILDELPALMEASPNFFSLAALPYGADATAGSPIFNGFLADTFGAGNPTIELVQEAFGYCFLPDCRFEKAFVFFGEGNTGKSTLAEVLMAMLDPANVSAIPLDRLG